LQAGKYKQAEEALKAWIYEAKYSTWNNPNELKAKYRVCQYNQFKAGCIQYKGQ
jgi:mRNA-degrading endonuclease HigB of HigAB toxin-antitoxin module